MNELRNRIMRIQQKSEAEDLYHSAARETYEQQRLRFRQDQEQFEEEQKRHRQIREDNRRELQQVYKS